MCHGWFATEMLLPGMRWRWARSNIDRPAWLACQPPPCRTTAGPKTFLCVPPCPAGSGKTTLLAIVAGSAEDLDKRSVLTGSVLMDGQPIHPAQRRKVGLWIAAESTHVPVTVDVRSVA